MWVFIVLYCAFFGTRNGAVVVVFSFLFSFWNIFLNES